MRDTIKKSFYFCSILIMLFLAACGSDSGTTSVDDNIESSSVEQPLFDGGLSSSSPTIPGEMFSSSMGMSGTSSSSSILLPFFSSSSVAESSSSYRRPDYDCSKYNCVTTQYLNQEYLAEGVYGDYLDTRDSKVYRTIFVEGASYSAKWMAQNMNYAIEGESYCRGGVEADCDSLGRFYSLGAAKNACPTGWHLATQGDVLELFNAANSIGKKRDARVNSLLSATGWNGQEGTDEIGLSFLKTGVYIYSTGETDGEGVVAVFWMKDLTDNGEGLKDVVFPAQASTDLFKLEDVSYRDNSTGFYVTDVIFPVRCVNDTVVKRPVVPSCEMGLSSKFDSFYNTVQDLRDCKTYSTTKIGNQYWTLDNADYESVNGETWEGNGARLYSYSAALNACPVGWRLPNKPDWEELLNTLNPGGYNNKSLPLLEEFMNIHATGFINTMGNYREDREAAYFWAGGGAFMADFRDEEIGYMAAMGAAVRCIKKSDNE